MTQVARSAPDGYYDPGGEFELRGQSEPLRQQSLRSVQGFRTGHTGRRIGEYRARASLGSGQDGQGTDRADASQSGQIRHRQCRSRHHAGACRRIVQARFQARPAERALWRRRPGNPGRYRQSNADRFCQSDSGHAAHPGRDVARHRRDLAQAIRGAARRADDDRARHPGPGIRNHAGCFRARRQRRRLSSRCSTARSSRRCISRMCRRNASRSVSTSSPIRRRSLPATSRKKSTAGTRSSSTPRSRRSSSGRKVPVIAERSEAIQSSEARLDCFVATLLAMTLSVQGDLTHAHRRHPRDRGPAQFDARQFEHSIFPR